MFTIKIVITGDGLCTTWHKYYGLMRYFMCQKASSIPTTSYMCIYSVMCNLYHEYLSAYKSNDEKRKFITLSQDPSRDRWYTHNIYIHIHVQQYIKGYMMEL